jgi:ribosome-associated translation inhibitor RaiA
MSLTLQVAYRGLGPSDSLDKLVHNEASKLEKLFARIVSCRVLVERRAVHHAGTPVGVRLNIVVPGADLADEAAHKDPAPAVRDAFRRARRRLKEYAHRRNGR